MKVIDLLNKPLDKLPKKIKVENKTYTLYMDEQNQHYYQDDRCKYFMFSISCFDELNEEVEIIEKGGIPEKLNLDTDELRGKETPRTIDYLIESKINQVIDYLQSKGDGSNDK